MEKTIYIKKIIFPCLVPMRQRASGKRLKKRWKSVQAEWNLKQAHTL